MSDFTLSPPILAAILCNAHPSSFSAPLLIITAQSLNQSQYSFPRFVIGLVLPLLLPTWTIWFSLDHKRNASDGVVSGIGTLFSLDHKLYASDYDCDSVASENQPSRLNKLIRILYSRLLGNFLPSIVL